MRLRTAALWSVVVVNGCLVPALDADREIAGTAGGSGGGKGGGGNAKGGSGNAPAGGTNSGGNGDGGTGDGATNSGGTNPAETGGAAGTGDSGGGGSGGAAPMPVTCPAGPFDSPAAGAELEVCEDFIFTHGYNEGPTWVAAQGAFYFSNFSLTPDVFTGDIIKYTPGGDCEIAFSDVGTNGLARSLDGNLIGASHLTRSVSHYNVTTLEVTTLVDMYQGELLDSPNDLIEHANGTIYFTNPTYQLGSREPGFGLAVFRFDPGTSQLSVIDEPASEPNGIALSPDGDRLYVVNSGIYDLDAQGAPSASAVSFDLSGDGLGVDCAGNVYRSGGNILSPDGTVLGTFPGGTNLAFGGADGMTMLVVHTGTGVRTVAMNVPGLP